MTRVLLVGRVLVSLQEFGSNVSNEEVGACWSKTKLHNQSLIWLVVTSQAATLHDSINLSCSADDYTTKETIST